MPRKSTQSAAGLLLALSLVVGSVIGIALGEPSMGLLGGLGLGIVLAVLSVLVARRKR